MKKHVLLTGATGLVGQYLVRDFLLEGTPLAVLIRSQEGRSAQDRLEQILTRWEGELGRSLAKPVCLDGDITQPGLGLNAQARRWVARHCGSVLHNAASLQFFGTDRAKDPWLSNLTGTTNVLELCRAARVRELHYMSTAYVCGKRTGTILETQLDMGQEFRNDYEECKFQAETLVRSADFIDRLTVYRPAIIVGDSRTGFTTSYHALYSYFYFVWLLFQSETPEADGRFYADVRLTLTGDEHRNLVPVEWVSALTSHIFHHPEHHGQTYHLTPHQPTTAREIHVALSEYFNFYGPRFSGPDAMADGSMTTLEQMFYNFIAQYEPYWSQEPEFDCSQTFRAAPNLPCPRVDVPCMHRLLDFAIADNWGKRRKKSTGKKRKGVAVS